jgi:putative NADPH-quinone reductase
MKILMILAHPNKKSFNHAIAATAVKALQKKGHKVYFHDLYAERFDPLLSQKEILDQRAGGAVLKRHCSEIVSADGIIVVHPNWWGQPPAILKGWVDRVVRQGVTYKFVVGDKGEGVPVGLLKAKKAIVFNTANTPDEREKEIFGDPLGGLWRKCIFNFCGIQEVVRKVFSVVIISTPEQRAQWLEEVRALVEKMF